MPHGQAAALEARQPIASSSQRLLAIGGILLIVSGMLLGDIFAIFILHPNNARIGEAMYAAAQLVPLGDAEGIVQHFMAVGGFLENRGTKVAAHSHIIHMGYIALLLAMIQPWVALSPASKRRAAWFYIVPAALLAPSIIAIHYVGKAYSPFEHIGWASIFADFFGACLALAVFIQLLGLWRYARSEGRETLSPAYIGAGNAASRALLLGGLLLLVGGFLYGAALAAYKDFAAAPQEIDILKAIVANAAAAQQSLLDQSFADYGQFLKLRALNIAAHAHINEVGILVLLVSFVQAFVQFSDNTRLRWAQLMVFSAFALPAGILLEIPYGIVGSIIADWFGFMLIVSLLAMMFGMLRHTGADDAAAGGKP